MRTLMASALFLPLALFADPTHAVKVHVSNDTDSRMHFDTLTIGQDTRVVDYPREIIHGQHFPQEAVMLTSQSDRSAKSQMTYQFILPAEMCENGVTKCYETVTLNWQTNMGTDGGDSSICGVSGKNFEPLEKIRAYCNIPTIDPNDPSMLHIHYHLDYAG
ncbi:MAG: hypothetical protein ACHQAX_00600 [Gammaproteobacteria bacterium]